MTDRVLSERSIFEAAIEQGSPEERAAYLDRACGSDPGLRRQVEALLAAHERLGDIPLPATAEDICQSASGWSCSSRCARRCSMPIRRGLSTAI
jgi:hypothetical protein